MTPEEKARELVEKFTTKECALIAVDMLLSGDMHGEGYIEADIDFYEKVKEAINKL